MKLVRDEQSKLSPDAVYNSLGSPASFRPKRPLLVCFSHLRWNFVWQRPQHLLSQAAGRFDILFIEEPVFEGGATGRLRVERVAPGIEVAVPLLGEAALDRVERVQADLIRDELARRQNEHRVFWYYTPAAIGFSATLDRSLTIYDNMDELSAFHGASSKLVAQERELFAQADIVFTGGRSLFDAKRDAHANIHCFPSSVETRHFGRAREMGPPDPADQAAIPHPRLGFFGVIDERFDRDFAAAMADLRPDWQFVMIGPVVKIDPATLPSRPNLHWLGPKPYRDLPDYLRHWDLGLMPFALNEATRFISPTKTPEFLAAGLRVVSTPIVDVIRDYGEDGLVSIAETPVAACLAAEALMSRPTDAWLERVDRRLAAESWERTWAEMQGLIDQGLHAAPSGAPQTPARAVAVSL